MNKRKAILQAIQSKLETSEIVSSSQVFYCHDNDFEYSIDSLDFCPIDEEVEQINLPFQKELFIRVRVIKFGQDLLTIGEDTLFELEKTIVNETWNGYAQKTVYLRNKISSQTSGKRLVKVEVYLKVVYRINSEDYD